MYRSAPLKNDWQDFDNWYLAAYGDGVYGTSHHQACKAAWSAGARIAVERFLEAEVSA